VLTERRKKQFLLKKKKRAKTKRKMPLLMKAEGEGKGGLFVSLRLKFAMVLIISALMMISIALLLIPVAARLITQYYMEPSRMDARLDDYILDFSDYVAAGNITSDDAASMAKWSMYHRNVHLVFGGNDAQLGIFGGEILEDDNLPVIDDPILTDNISMGAAAGNTYAVRFSDRVCTVSIMDYSGVTVYNAVYMGGIITAMSVFFLIMVLYYHSQTKAIMRLSADVERVSGGALAAPIESKRNDEIGGLARDVDTMRTTILQKMEEEKNAREANGQLITSMSHDIRTPLTTLLGYVELLQNECEGMTEEQVTYVKLCAEKAGQIKELSDKLFLYFWAYSAKEERVDTESCDILLLGEQITGDWTVPMENEGFVLSVQMDRLPANTHVLVNTECLRRIIDNIFDNIRKYAHREHPVEITISQGFRGRQICLTFSNRIADTDRKTTGTHIGHKTCENMAKLMGGRFEARTKGDSFSARLYLPASHMSQE